MGRVLLIMLVACTALMGAGCGLQAASTPDEEPTITVPRLAQLSPLVQREAHVSLPALQRDSARRQAQTLTVRVRNVGCEGVGVGSGFALTPRLLITNRHVLAGADALEVDTWDGHTFKVHVAVVGTLGDLGIAEVEGTLPRVARFGQAATASDEVTVVGYPLGGPLALSSGTVIDRVDGLGFDVAGPVLRLTTPVEPGNSGGPVLDSQGRVVAVVFATEIATGFALAIPVDTLVRLAEAGGFQTLPPCGFE